MAEVALKLPDTGTEIDRDVRQITSQILRDNAVTYPPVPLREIVRNYPVDGLHLDYIRFPNERVTIIVLRNYEIEIYDRLEIELAEIVFGEEK